MSVNTCRPWVAGQKRPPPLAGASGCSSTKNNGRREGAWPGAARSRRGARHGQPARTSSAAATRACPAPMVDRLKLRPKVIETVALGCEQLAGMADVIGEIIGMATAAQRLRVGQMRVPIGVGRHASTKPPQRDHRGRGRRSSRAMPPSCAAARKAHANRTRRVAHAGCRRRWPRPACRSRTRCSCVQTTDRRRPSAQLIAMPRVRRRDHSARGGKGLIEAHRAATPRCRSSSTWTATATSTSTTRPSSSMAAAQSSTNAQDPEATAPAAAMKACWSPPRWPRNFLPKIGADLRRRGCRDAAAITRSQITLPMDCYRSGEQGWSMAVESDWSRIRRGDQHQGDDGRPRGGHRHINHYSSAPHRRDRRRDT